MFIPPMKSCKSNHQNLEKCKANSRCRQRTGCFNQLQPPALTMKYFWRLLSQDGVGRVSPRCKERRVTSTSFGREQQLLAGDRHGQPPGTQLASGGTALGQTGAFCRTDSPAKATMKCMKHQNPNNVHQLSDCPSFVIYGEAP